MLIIVLIVLKKSQIRNILENFFMQIFLLD